MLPKSLYKVTPITTRTPMRITLAGGGTDVLWYSRVRGGEWISAAIDKYIYVSVNKYNNGNLIKLSDGVNKPVVTKLTKLKNDIIRECLLETGIIGGITIDIQSDTSAKSGLGGSGSLEVGLLHALHAYNGEKIKPLQLAQEASNIEINRLNRPVGPQDQYIAALGGIRSFKINKKGKVTSESLDLSTKTVNKLRKNLIFFATGIQKDTQKILSKEKNKSQNILVLDKIKNLGKQTKKYLTAAKMDEFGETLHKHWLIKKELSSQVSSRHIDEWYNEAINLGALGGKIMGAGGGGWFVFYVNKNHASFISHMMKKGLHHEKVKFDWEGTKFTKGNLHG